MSMQIKFKDDYNETTYYFGTVTEPESTSHGECDFVVEVVYFSKQGSYTVSSIEWVNEPEDKEKAEERITLMVMKWHYEDPSDTIERENIISPHDPGDEND